jgi:hypothetical protein
MVLVWAWTMEIMVFTFDELCTKLPPAFSLANLYIYNLELVSVSLFNVKPFY